MNIPLQILADLPSLGINANEWTAGCASAAGPWIAGGVGFGVAIVAVLVGWAKLRKIADDEHIEPEDGADSDELVVDENEEGDE
jgi:hypothetical protein